jgi:mono/diheme cytochrome c family protein
MVVLRILLAMVLPFTASCLAESPQEAEPAVQGDYEDGDEEHRPGQPCLLCHSSDGHFPAAPGEKTFEIGGTVYGSVEADEDDGLEDVEVIFRDARGDEFAALSNRAGNFLVEVNSSLSAPRRRSKGVLQVPRKPLYPLEVRIRRGENEQRMKTKIWRNGSCAHCHGPKAGADSVGRIDLFNGTILQ